MPRFFKLVSYFHGCGLKFSSHSHLSHTYYLSPLISFSLNFPHNCNCVWWQLQITRLPILLRIALFFCGARPPNRAHTVSFFEVSRPHTHSIQLLRTSDQHFAEAANCAYIRHTTDEHPSHKIYLQRRLSYLRTSAKVDNISKINSITKSSMTTSSKTSQITQL
jgi:hypothetical protein